MKVLKYAGDEKGFELRMILYSNTETVRQIKVPWDVSFHELHNVIQKLFNFDDYHMWEFKVPAEIPGEDAVDLENIVQTVSYEDAWHVGIKRILDENDILVYEYDFGAGWEIIIQKIDSIDYKNKTALLTDYTGKYSPMDDIDVFVFDEIMEAIDNGENVEYILDDYGLKKSDLTKMDFEKKYKIGSRIRFGK